jgi:hypothetical protein
MSVRVNGAVSGLDADVDGNRNICTAEGLPYIGAAGGFYTVGGQISAVVAAALAANTMLMSMRLNPSSSRKAYLTKLRVVLSIATAGAAGGIPGTLGLQRFTAQTPTGGTARTVNRLAESLGTSSDLFDVRDSNAALTGTAPTWGNVVSTCLVPLLQLNTSGLGGGFWEWIFEPAFPLILQPGDGLALRTQVAMPATQTWVYSYTAHWFER